MLSSITWLGHATIRLETKEGLVIFIDPWISSNPMHPTKTLPDKADVILVTHDHFDHVADVVELAKHTGAKVVAQPETINRFVQSGLAKEQAVEMNIGGTIDFKQFKAKMVHAFHSSNTGQPAGYIVTFDSVNVYHLGDTGLFSDLQLFGQLYSIDYAFIPIGGHYTMDYKDAAVAAKMLQARHVIPIHYKTFPLLLQNAEDYVKEVERVSPDTKVIVPEIGEYLEL